MDFLFDFGVFFLVLLIFPILLMLYRSTAFVEQLRVTDDVSVESASYFVGFEEWRMS